MKKYMFFFITSMVLASTCIAQSYQERFFALAQPLTKLTAAIEKTLRDKHVDQNLSDEALVKLATEHNSSLIKPFRDFQIKLSREKNYVILLVCTKDGAGALFEDASCTTEMDYNRWMPKQLFPCTFTLSSDICN